METATDFKLENGLRFIVAEDHAAPVASFGVFVRAGACDEPEDRRGIAHFFEHMMFRGSERFGPKEHSDRISRLGGDCNAGTSIDPTIYYETFPSAALESIFELEADRFMRLKLLAEHVDVERKVVLEELAMYENQPMSRAFRLLMREIGKGHPYGLDPLGRKEDLLATGVGDLEDFRRRLYRPGNVFAVVTGDVRRDEVEALARRHFGAWRDPADLGQPRQVPDFHLPSGHMRLRLPLEVPVVARIHRLKPSREEDHPALDLLTALLADGESSPVQERMVKKTRLCVHAGGQSLKLLRGGALVFFGAFLPPGRHSRRLAELRSICDRVAAEGPPREEFARRLKRFRSSLARARYSSMEVMSGLGHAELQEGGYDKYERALDNFAAVTPERIQALARRLFAPENTLELEIESENSHWWLPLVGLGMKVIGR